MNVINVIRALEAFFLYFKLDMDMQRKSTSYSVVTFCSDLCALELLREKKRDLKRSYDKNPTNRTFENQLKT